MALIVITMNDTEDGGIDITAKSEPFIPLGLDAEVAPTPAQIAAQIALAAVGQALSGEEDE